MADFITASICVSDIPREAIKVAENGKKYISIVIAENKDGANKYGNTHYICMSQSKEERDVKAERVYIGNGKAYQPKTQETVTPVTVEAVAEMPSVTDAEADDLPF